MSYRFGLLIALPLLLALGCTDTAFTPVEGDRRLAQEDEFTSPLADCGKPNAKKVLVCHVPPGNPLAKHTICVSEAGAAHGHGLNLADVYAVGSHGGDLLGACDDELPDSGCPAEGC